MTRPALATTLLALAILALAALEVFYAVPAHAAGQGCVLASYYGTESGDRTADGSYFDGTQMIAASRTLPMGTRLRVWLRGRSVLVTVRDRGPAQWTGRSLDLSKEAARHLGMLKAGVACVTVEQLR